VEDIPDGLRQDPMFWQTNGENPGRDGCRVPLPWSGDDPPFGFSPPGSVAPWLPQPADWRTLTVAAQQGDPSSMLELYRSALRARDFTGPLTWLDAPPGVLTFARDDGFLCAANLSGSPVVLPSGSLILASGPLYADGTLPPDAAAWLRA
jgi:alpha-glucosidase